MARVPTSPDPVALVTGATGGIGRAIARRLAADGFRVVVHHNRDGEAAAALRNEIGAGRTEVVEADLTDADAVQAVGARLADDVGRLDVLVNNAGVMEQSPFENLTEEVWSHVMAVNLTGAFRVTSACLAQLRRSDRACVVNIASQLAYTGGAGAVAYTASKAGLLGFTRALARDVGPAIRVNAVAPGPVDTPMTAAHATPEWVREKTAKLVMGRFGRPAEIAAAVAFLVSEEASFITGQTISVNGGGAMP